MTSLKELNDEFIAPLNLIWQLDERSRRRLIQAAALPALLIVAMLIRIPLLIVYSPAELADLDEFGAPELWQALYRLLTTLDILTPTAVAILFLAGLRAWSRAEGSWMLLVGGLLATIAMAFGVLYALVLTVTDDQEVLNDLRVNWLWYDITQTFGLLAVGFFFVAYRGLSSPPAELHASITDNR
jgi:hypothetical protein